MKHIIAIFVLLITVSVFASHIQFNSHSPDGKIWKFEVYNDVKDQWDSFKSEFPPLSPKKAMDIATAFMKRIPPGDRMVAWEVSKVSLLPMFGSGSSEKTHWIYEIHFSAVVDPKIKAWNGPVSQFTVLVRMDGSIPDPKIEIGNERTINRSEQPGSVGRGTAAKP